MLGISPDDVESHRKFRERLGLPFRLLSDPDHAVAHAYGVWKRRSLFGLGIEAVRRTAFVIDAEGRLVEVIRRTNPFGHAERAKRAIERLR